MRIVRAGILAALAAATVLVSPADARRLLQDGALEAHVLEGDWCGETIYVEIRSPTRDSFAGDAFQVRRMTAILTNILPFECPEARRMTLVGSVGGAAVWQGSASVADGEVAAMPPPSPDALVPLDERTRVREIQQSLTALGYDAGVPDGLMGPATRSAIQAFQSDSGLPATGQPSPGVVTALRGQGSGQFADSGGLAASQSGPVMSGGTPQPGTFPSAFAQPLNAGPAGAPGLMAAPTSPQRQALAARGFETFEGRIVLPGPIYSPERLRDVDFGPVLARMALATAPEIGQDWNAVSQLTHLLSPEDRRRILLAAAPDMVALQQARLEAQDYRIDWQTLTNLGFNEFQMQRILQGFRDIGQPRLIAEAPVPPIPVLVACRVSIGDYDFTDQRFDLGAFNWCDSIATTPVLSIRTGFSTDSLPEYLDVPVAEAEAFLTAIGSEREIVAGIALTIAGMTLNGGPNVIFDLIQRPEAVIFFHDDRFQREIRRIDLGPSDAPSTGVAVDPARLIVDDNVPLIARQAALLALASSPDLLDDDRRALAYADLLAEGDQRSLLAGAGVDYELTVGRAGSIQSAAQAYMDEFARRRLLALFRSDYAQSLAAVAPSPPIPLLLDCRIPVREYDFEEGYFPFDDNIERYCDWRQISADIPAMAIRHAFDVSGLPRGIAVPLAEAQAFKDMHLGSGARVGLELSIIGMKEIEPERSARRFQLEITTDGAVLFSAADEGLRSPIRRFDMREDEPAASTVSAAAPVAPIQLRQPATAMLLMLKYGLFEPTEEEWRHWAGARARWERNDRNRDWPHFFDGVDISSRDLSTMIDPVLIPRFMEWTRARAANLPETLLFGSGGSFTLRDEQLRDGRMPLFRRSSSSGNHSLAVNLAVPADRLDSMRLAQDGTWPIPFGEVVIVLPSAAGDFQVPFDPSTLQPGQSVTLEADMSVTGIRIVSDGRKDHLVADVAPTAGRLIDYQTGATVATVEFDSTNAVATTAVPFPPEAYFPVLRAEMAGEDPLEAVYEALGSGLDAFARRERARELVAEAEAFDPGPDGVWAAGRLRFDDYDFATGSFPLSRVSLEGYGDGVQNSVVLAPTVPGLFVLVMPPDEAQAWQQANPSHPNYALRVRVRPVSLTDGWSRPALTVEILEAELLDEEEILTANDPSRIRREIFAAPAVETAAPPPEESEAPAIAEASGGFDILGVGLGADMEKAVSTIAAEIGETVRYEARREERIAATGGNMWDPFNEGMMLRTPDATQTIMIYHEPPLADGSVTAISRWIIYPEGEGPPVAAVRDLLIEKYGEPRQADERENHIYMSWAAGMPEDEQYQCDTDAGVLVFGQWTLDDAPWIGPEGPLFTDDSPGTPFVAQVSEPGAFVADGFIGKMEYDEPRCQEMLISLIIMASDGRVRQILTALSDPLAIADMVEGNRLTMIGETEETAVGEIDLKL